MLSKIVGDLLINKGQDLKDGKCELDDEELLELSKCLLHRKMNIDKTCREYNLTRQMLDYKIKQGDFPVPIKKPGDSKYFWQDEIENFIKEKNNKNE